MKKHNTVQSVDDEWSSFISSNHNNSISDEEDDDDDDDENFNIPNILPLSHSNSNVAPEPSKIYISTKSKVAYLNIPIDLSIFWKIPVIPYAVAKNGIIKKQIKSNTTCFEEFTRIQEMLIK